MVDIKEPAGEEAGPYAHPGPPPIIWQDFSAGLNTNATRPFIKDEELFWTSGYFPLGPGFLRSIPGIGPAIFSVVGVQIVFIDFFNISTTPYMFAITSDGAMWAVNTTTNAVMGIAPPGTITNPSRGSGGGISQWGDQFLIIVAPQPNGYWLWDGAILYSAGGAVPPGFMGTMPTGISGSSVETYASRVWVASGATVNFSAPSSPVDFTTPNGGGSFTSNDSFLRIGFVQLRQSNGFLYLIADSSVNYISGVQTNGSGVTTFTNQNADPEVGTPFQATVDVFGNNILFANSFGVQLLYGGKVTKISDNLDGVYATTPNFNGQGLSACKAIIYGKKVWCLLIPVVNPITGSQAQELFIWDTKKWFSTLQDVQLGYVQHQEINSVITAYGLSNDGLSVYPLFQTPSSNFPKVVQSKLWDRPDGYQFIKTISRFWGMVQYYNTSSPDFTLTIDNETGSSDPYNVIPPFVEVSFINASGDEVTLLNSLGQEVILLGSNVGISVIEVYEVAQQGTLSGMTLTTNCPDVALLSFMIQPEVVVQRI